MTEILKTKRVLEGNLWNLFAILISLCDSETKHRVESSPKFNDLGMTLDSMGLLALIKKLVYTGGANNKQVWHNKAMAIMKLMTLYKEKFQDIQEFRVQYLAIWKVCNELRINFGRFKDVAKAMLTKQGITGPTTAQLKKATDKVEVELHIIALFWNWPKRSIEKINLIFIQKNQRWIEHWQPLLKFRNKTQWMKEYCSLEYTVLAVSFMTYYFKL